ncbi:uncharacterized protein LOC124289761 isoform X1 [Haliotis rubra]|uniref:uncharacterized protein LOC124289761 isoform X1 n=1 Tax=Haliotis rubra TaxID=36100 RepID=UPI001EE5A955|nr:uncharacterized protein LOC124289761 isoform X1 [Haliotis rubra]
MGPSCQYVNHAAEGTASLSSGTPSKVNDGRDDICTYTNYEREHTVGVSFTDKRWITEMQITTQRTQYAGTIENVVVEGEVGGHQTVCSSPYSSNDGLVFNIVCDRPILATTITATLTLTTSSYVYVCEVRLNGGINIAVKKPTNQTSNYSESWRAYSSDLAVDGNTQSTFEGNSCAHTSAECDTDYRVHWTLNLEASYVPLMIRIYNRTPKSTFTRLLSGFSLQVVSSGSTIWENIYTDTSADPGEIIRLVSSSFNFIHLLRVTTPKCQTLALCEVQMFTVCPDFRYGFDCSLSCRCKDQAEVCEKMTGSCSSGCPAGFTGRACTEECQSGFYGDNCQQECIQCLDKKCGKADGQCTEGCAAGWVPSGQPWCTEECPNGSFGLNCASRCRCLNSSETCDKISGHCQTGCAAGFTGSGCQTQCSQGWFGVNCQESCGTNCKNNVCDGETGVCTDGCEAGYTGDKCGEQCREDFYGENCSEKCSENCTPRSAGRACRLRSGTCRSGCQPGWTSSYCNTKCRPGWYGSGCYSRCSYSCLNSSCHHVNGSCTFGCVAGRQGDTCQDDCALGFYGESCKFPCSVGCRDKQRCYSRTGNCENGCGPGWLGDKCTEKCPNGTFGDRCSSRCNSNCNSGVCNNVNGECSQGCVPGFMGSQCNDECSNGTYGPGCREECSEGCLDGICGGSDGKCQCYDGWRGDRCHLDCEPGFYGSACAVSCSPNCAGSVCGRSTGLCSSCQSGWTGETCQQAEGMGIPAIAGIAVAALLIILLAVIIAVVLVRRKSGRKEEQGVRDDNTPAATSHSVKMITINKSSNATTSKKEGSSQISLLGTATENNVDGAGEVYYNIASTSRSATAVSLVDFPEYVRKWRSQKQHLFDEFQKLPKDLINDHSIAFAAHNIKKNRYKNICAFDHSRVVLQTDPQDPGVGDYINACYIDTPKKKKAFIAAQGPNEPILNDFVRMLWEHDVTRVVMLTNLFEEGKQKCNQYWPDKGDQMFGKVSVSIRDTQQHADYTIRKFALKKDGCKARSVTQYHYTAWPDKGVPRSPWSLLDFRDKVMNFRTASDSPVVVHCSAGIGRTGTFIALQYLKEEAELSALQDVYTCVWNLRHQRVNMVQTKNQYVFIHEAALVSLILTKSVFTVNEFRQKYDSLVNDQQRLQKEFQTLQGYPVCDTEGEYNRALNNSEKNRCDTILAGDSSRAILMPRAEYDDMGGTYINAVFLPGFEKTKKFLQTQTPLTNTVFDFWRMVSDYLVTRIIMLDDYTANDEDAAVYWPDVHTPLELGPFQLKCLNTSQNSEIVFRQLELKEDDYVTKIAHYTVKFWPEGGLPSTDSLLQLMQMSGVTTNQKETPIIVHCRSGAQRSGLFCAVATMLERAQVDLTVAVPVVVGNNKAIRKHNITDVSQYTLCYKILAEHVASEAVYSNNGVDDSADVVDEEGDANVYSNIEEAIYSNQ